MSRDAQFRNIQKTIGSALGQRTYLMREAPNVKVISTGLYSLDVATGIGGWPVGTMVELFGRESVGKTALALLTIESVTKTGGTAAFINLESKITQESWVKWALKIAPGINMDRVQVFDAKLGQESVELFSKLIASNAFDVVVFDSIGAMGTDAELEVGGKKQAYGQSGMVTQMVKQAAQYARETDCVAILLNQIRDKSVQAGAKLLALEKAPGGHAKDHFATIRVHLKPNTRDIPMIQIDGKKIAAGFRVEAQLVKNKTGTPRRTAGWNFYNYEGDGLQYGFDRAQDIIDTCLQQGTITRGGAWYYHDSFPDGKIQSAANVKKFVQSNPDDMELIRREMVLNAYNDMVAEGVTEEEADVVVDALGEDVVEEEVHGE